MPKQITNIYESDKIFRTLFESATIGIVVVCNKCFIMLANPFAEKLFSYKRNELKGQKLEVLIPDDLKKMHAGHHAGYFKNPKERTMGLGMELFAKRKDGALLPVEISLGHYEIDGEICAATYITDITARKKGEESLKKSEENLNKLNKELEERVYRRTQALAKAIDELAESKRELEKSLEKEKELNELKSRFVTTASHEFRTPLATILSSSSLIEKYNEKEDEPKRRKHLQRIQSSVNNLIEILNDFLSIGKLEEGVIHNKPEPLQVNNFVGGVVDGNRAVLKKDQKVNYHHIGSKHETEADPQMFKNIILNLLSNAAKYSNEGQAIDITTQVIPDW